MIQIDDSGSGSLIGGTCIGVLDTENNKYYYDIIPIELFNYENFKNKLYLDYVINIIKDAFDYLNVDTYSKIMVCRGYMFDKLRVYLKSNGYNWESSKISDPLQNNIERSFEDYTISLGFPYKYIKYTKYPFHFHKILRWVYSDYNNRKHLCKTGWKSWQKYCNLPLEYKIDFIYCHNKYHCLKCGKIINFNKKVTIIKYTSNAPNIIYLHEEC